MGGGGGQGGGEVLACWVRRVMPWEMPNTQVRFLLVISQLEYIDDTRVHVICHRPFQNYGETGDIFQGMT